jgi:hypothetical protein
MTDRTVNNLPAATHCEPVRCLFAIELSTKSWVIAFNTPLSEKISRRTLTGCKWKGLLELIEQVRARVSRETGRTVEVVSCYEAGYDGFCTGNLKRTASAITLLIRQACRWTGGRDEQRQIGLTLSGCCAG